MTRAASAGKNSVLCGNCRMTVAGNSYGSGGTSEEFGGLPRFLAGRLYCACHLTVARASWSRSKSTSATRPRSRAPHALARPRRAFLLAGK
jgi:hypothetical protein